jgi:hypothetical protein
MVKIASVEDTVLIRLVISLDPLQGHIVVFPIRFVLNEVVLVVVESQGGSDLSLQYLDPLSVQIVYAMVDHTPRRT